MGRKPKDKPKTKAEIKAAADRAEKRGKTTKKADTLPKTASGKVAAQPKNLPRDDDGKVIDFVTLAINKGYKLPSQNDIRSLLKKCDNYKADMGETNGLLREKIAYDAKHKNLDPKVFATLRRFNDMETEKLADFWDRLCAYMELAGLFERIESVTRLPLGDTEQKAGGEDDDTDKVLEAADSQAAGGAGEEPAPPSEEVSRPRLATVAGQQIPA